MISNFIFNIKILNPSFQFLKQMMLKLIIQEKEIRNKQLIEVLKKYENVIHKLSRILILKAYRIKHSLLVKLQLIH